MKLCNDCKYIKLNNEIPWLSECQIQSNLDHTIQTKQFNFITGEEAIPESYCNDFRRDDSLCGIVGRWFKCKQMEKGSPEYLDYILNSL